MIYRFFLTRRRLSGILSASMRRFGAVFLGIALLVPYLLPSVAEASHGGAPKLLNLYLGYELTVEDATRLSKWDLVVLDMDQQFQFPEQIRLMRRLNPQIKILAYVSAGEIAEARFRGHPASPGRKLADRIPETWYLKKTNGARATWWPGAWAMNATDLGPTHTGERWNTFLGPFIRDELMSSGLWDGVFLDAAYEQVTSFYGKDLDGNLDGQAETTAVIDTAYGQGMDKLIRNVRNALGANRLILNNSSTAYASVVNGVLLENFPRSGFDIPFDLLRDAIVKNPTPKISAINTNVNNSENKNDYRLMRFGLASALIADAYFSFDAGDARHHRTWWYDEYEAAIGRPADKAVKSSGLWSREYTRGMVIVNPTAKAASYSLPGEYEHLSGRQDISVNTGILTNQVNLAAEDGVVLIRRAQADVLEGSAYINGSFLNVYAYTGERIQNGFFATRSDVPGGAEVLSVDLDRDGRVDTIYAQNGLVTVKFASGVVHTAKPLGNDYSGSFSLSAGQLDESPTWELVVSPLASNDAPPRVLVLDAELSVTRDWLAYGANFRNGLSLGIGDLDGDGKRELVTAPGPGGGAHIRSFRTDGVPWYGGFFAFDAAQNSGANLAVGDVDGDGIDDIVVGTGPGQLPLVRIYDARHRLKAEFRPLIIGTGGVRPVLSDVNDDGRMEILIPSNPF